MRAAVVAADGSGRRLIANELADNADTSTQFAGWSADGKTAIIVRSWHNPQNAQWEEENKTFRFNKDSRLVDTYLVDVTTGKAENVTAVERVSFDNTGLFFWSNDPTKLGFTALIDGASHPFRMDRDGRNKVGLMKDSKEFTYGLSSSRDGKRIAYRKNYQVFLADADGSNAKQVETGQSFNFAPTWSHDGKWVFFVSGEHYNCHPDVVASDGTGLRKLADRGGYRGVVEFLDVFDFHGGSSDVPVWCGNTVFYTAKGGETINLFRASIDCPYEQITAAAQGTLRYHPQPSLDGKWLTYGSKRDGARQLVVVRLSDRMTRQVTEMKAGHAAMWPHWRPQAVPVPKK